MVYRLHLLLLQVLGQWVGTLLTMFVTTNTVKRVLTHCPCTPPDSC